MIEQTLVLVFCNIYCNYEYAQAHAHGHGTLVNMDDRKLQPINNYDAYNVYKYM